MIWSLLKIILFVAAIAGLTYGAALLIETDEGLRLSMANFEVTLGPLQAVIGLLLLMLALWLLMLLMGLLVSVLRFLNGDETAISRYFDRSRERRGFQALSDGMLALASGEGHLAKRKAERAEKLLRRPDLTTLITAQASEMVGDRSGAEEAYKRLLSDDRTRFAGVRGLMKQRLAAGDTAVALKLAKKAFALKPKHSEIQDLLLKLQADEHDWKGARATLNAKARAGQLPRDVYRRRDAILALQEARDVFDEGKSIEARESAIAANKLSPDLIPAACMAARGYIAAGKPKYATRVLKKAWGVRPHPDLAAAFAEIVQDETPGERVARFRALTDLKPDHEETRLLRAELYIAAEDFPAARRALGDLVETHPTARVLTIMAAIARGEGQDDAVVRGWLSKALTANRGPQWTCDNCHNIHSQWVPICENCGGFDTLSWVEPPEGAGPSPTQTEMLPLLVGTPKPSGTEDATTVDSPGPDQREDRPAGAG
jgi:HemY protein